MSSGALNTLAIVLLLMPGKWFLYNLCAIWPLADPSGTFCQCIDCNAHWKFHCKTNLTGFYCAPGAYVHQWVVPEEDYHSDLKGFNTPFSACTPFPLEISSVCRSSYETTSPLNTFLLQVTSRRFAACIRPRLAASWPLIQVSSIRRSYLSGDARTALSTANARTSQHHLSSPGWWCLFWECLPC